MKTNYKKLDALLRQSDAERLPSRAKLDETILLSKKCIRAMQQEQEPSMFEFLLTQLRFISRKSILAQLLLFLVSSAVICISEDVPKQADLFISILIPLMVILAVPELCKSQRFETVSVEACTRYGMKKVYLARFLILGMMNLIVTTALTALGSGVLCIPMYELAIHFLVPYNSSLIICLTMMSFKKTRFSEVPALAANMIWSTILFAAILYFDIYERMALAAWAALLFLSLFYLCFIIKKILNESEYELEVIHAGTQKCQ